MNEIQQKVDRIRSLVQELLSIHPDDLVRKEELGPLSFEEGLPLFHLVRNLFKDIDTDALHSLPLAKLGDIETYLNEALQRFKLIQEFTLEAHRENPVAHRDRLISELRNQYHHWFDNLHTIIAYTIGKGATLEQLQQRAEEALARIDASEKEIAKKIQDMEQSADEILLKMRQAAQEIGVSQHAFHFKEEADMHRRAAHRWLWAAGLLALLTVVLGGYAFRWHWMHSSQVAGSQMLQLAISKVVVFSILITATVWAGRIYRAHRHNEVLNRHRQNALTTFETFAAAASDQQVKDAVLLQATQCIFLPQATGYTSPEPESASLPQVHEFIRHVSGR